MEIYNFVLLVGKYVTMQNYRKHATNKSSHTIFSMKKKGMENERTRLHKMPRVSRETENYRKENVYFIVDRHRQAS